MLRMDLLLNPGSPPASPVRSDPLDSQLEPQVVVEQVAQTPLPLEPFDDENQHPTSLVDVVALLARQRQAVVTPDSPSTVPAVKRLKRELPTLRLLLDNGVDNQRDDAPHEIFSGHAFWGKVPSLNPSVSPTDVAHIVAASTKPILKAVADKSHGTLAREVGGAPLLPNLAVLASSAVATNENTVDAAGNSTEVESLSSENDTSATVPSSKNGKKKKITICKEDGCSSQALSKQLCMKHGGGPRCSVPDCNNGAKLRNLCFQHGGSTICLADGCNSKAKRFGYCWSHGGGRICGEEDCNKVAAQGGMCWAHGGGNRCKQSGCTKRSYKQHGYFCKRHAEVSADY